MFSTHEPIFFCLRPRFYFLAVPCTPHSERMLGKQLSFPDNSRGKRSGWLLPVAQKALKQCFLFCSRTQIFSLPGAERDRKWPGRRISGAALSSTTDPMVSTGRNLKVSKNHNGNFRPRPRTGRGLRREYRNIYVFMYVSVLYIYLKTSY